MQNAIKKTAATLRLRSEGACVGLINQGATCYVNSLLQIWYQNPFVRFVQRTSRCALAYLMGLLHAIAQLLLDARSTRFERAFCCLDLLALVVVSRKKTRVYRQDPADSTATRACSTRPLRQRTLAPLRFLSLASPSLPGTQSACSCTLRKVTRTALIPSIFCHHKHRCHQHQHARTHARIKPYVLPCLSHRRLLPYPRSLYTVHQPCRFERQCCSGQKDLSR